MKTTLLKTTLLISILFTSQLKAQDDWFTDCDLPNGMVIYGTDLYFTDSGNRTPGSGSLSKIDLTVEYL